MWILFRACIGQIRSIILLYSVQCINAMIIHFVNLNLMFKKLFNQVRELIMPIMYHENLYSNITGSLL